MKDQGLEWEAWFNSIRAQYQREGAILAYTWVLENLTRLSPEELKQQITSALEALTHADTPPDEG